MSTNRCFRGSKASAHESVRPCLPIFPRDQNGPPERVETTEILGRSQQERQRPRSREAWPSLDSGGVKEKDGGGWQLFFRILEKLAERIFLPVPCVQRAAFHSHKESPGATGPSVSLIVADRISMPRKAAVVPLDDWNHPKSEASCAPVTPRYFDVNMSELRALCSCMLRSGLGKKNSSCVIPFSSLWWGIPSSQRILVETDLSVIPDPVTGQNDSLENVICLGLLDSGASSCQVIVSSAFIFVTFQLLRRL